MVAVAASVALYPDDDPSDDDKNTFPIISPLSAVHTYGSKRNDTPKQPPTCYSGVPGTIDYYHGQARPGDSSTSKMESNKGEKEEHG